MYYIAREWLSKLPFVQCRTTDYQSLTTFIGHVFDRVTPRNLINWTNTASVFLYPIQFYNLWVAALTPKEFRFQFSWWKKMQPNFMHGWAHFLLDSISLATDKKFEAFSGLAIKIQAKAAAGAEKQSNEKNEKKQFLVEILFSNIFMPFFPTLKWIWMKFWQKGLLGSFSAVPLGLEMKASGFHNLSKVTA